MQPIFTSDAPAPRGHYAQALTHNGTVYVSGILPLDPASGELVAGEIEAQVARVLDTLQIILAAAGSGLDCVLKVTVYVSDISLWGRVNTVYAHIFGDHRPARTVAPVNSLHYGALVELDAIACVRG
jgi:2-iminobutanoate/2-iminopropanoate deaminase